jgi:hypothetical protein
MEFIKNIFLFQVFLITALPQILSASSQENKFATQPAQRRMWHPLLCAIQQANLNEVRNIMMTIDKNDRILTGYITPLAIAQANAQDKHFHPTIRQKYYEMCQILQDFGIESSYSTEPMASRDVMLQEHRESHKEIIAITQFVDEHKNKKIDRPSIKKYHRKHYKS